MDALVKPLPSELTTPPVTKMYFVFVMGLNCTGKRASCKGWHCYYQIHGTPYLRIFSSAVMIVMFSASAVDINKRSKGSR